MTFEQWVTPLLDKSELKLYKKTEPDEFGFLRLSIPLHWRQKSRFEEKINKLAWLYEAEVQAGLIE